jgi:NAD(P)H-nitrite reductase large subunit
MASNSKIAIIGNGCAGAECIISLRKSGYRGEIHNFTDSRWPVYNPMLTTYYVSGKIGFDRLFPYGKDDDFYREFSVNEHPSSPVTGLDAEKKIVANQAGLEVNYSQCLIATGASTITPPIQGIDSDRVYYMRTVEDAIRLKRSMDKKPRRALVAGASMIGIKLVEVFYRAGVEVCLVDLADRIFPLISHKECSCLIERRLLEMGIKLRFGANIKRIEEVPAGIKASFDGCTESEVADLMVMSVGVRANTGFINRDQVEVKQGVLVEEHMQTNLPGLYAAGDVSQGHNLLTGTPQIIGLWANARYQGRTAGRNMAGIPETYPGNIPHNITHFMGMDFVGMGDVCEYDRMEIKHTGNRFLQLFWKDNLLSGANFIDANNESGVIKSALIKGLLQNKNSHSDPLPVVQSLLINKILTEVEE